tara:strand:+ start:454 stop:672 length:219 start_codon:yes stop_codon:yes gene_type:complete
MKDGKAYFVEQEEKISNTYMNAAGGRNNRPQKYSNFMGTGISTFKILWWGVGALMIIYVAGKGIKLYREIKK